VTKFESGERKVRGRDLLKEPREAKETTEPKTNSMAPQYAKTTAAAM